MTPAQTEARSRAPKGEGDRLRDELLDAAERLLVRKGSTDAVSVRAITRAVGVSAPSLYLHFADKDDLFLAVCSRRFEEFREVMLAAIDGIDDPAEQLRALGEAYIDYGLGHPEHYAIIFGHTVELAAIDDPSELPGIQAFEVLVDVIDRGMRAGRFAACDPREAAVATWCQVHGYVTLASRADLYAHERIDIAAARDTVLRQTLLGLLAR